MAGELPPDWRERLIAMVRGAEPLREDWFTPGPVLSSLQRVGIYAEQFRLRVEGAVRAEAPGLVHLMGDASEDTIRRFLAACPPETWTLHRVAVRLADWLARDGAPRSWVEMARLDQAVQLGFEAADVADLAPEDLAGSPRLVLQPHVALLNLSFDVHRVRSAVLTGEPAPPLVEGRYLVVVFRRNRQMRHWEVHPGLFALLEGIGAEGATVSTAIDRAFRGGRVDLPTLQEHVGQWFRDLSERSLVTVRDA